MYKCTRIKVCFTKTTTVLQFIQKVIVGVIVSVVSEVFFCGCYASLDVACRLERSAD